MYPAFKRFLDITISAFLILITLPVTVPVALAICATSKGPWLFRHERVGQHGKIFPMMKFRSMVHKPHAAGDYFTHDNDPRITPLGKLLRRSSLDELPQLLNVLVGHMSLIGPRPDTLAQKTNYSEEDWQLRHRVKPGITGLAQVMGRSDITPEDRLAYDLHYAANVSFKMDVRIALLTIQRVLARAGAN